MRLQIVMRTIVIQPQGRITIPTQHSICTGVSFSPELVVHADARRFALASHFVPAAICVVNCQEFNMRFPTARASTAIRIDHLSFYFLAPFFTFDSLAFQIIRIVLYVFCAASLFLFETLLTVAHAFICRFCTLYTKANRRTFLSQGSLGGLVVPVPLFVFFSVIGALFTDATSSGDWSNRTPAAKTLTLAGGSILTMIFLAIVWHIHLTIVLNHSTNYIMERA